MVDNFDLIRKNLRFQKNKRSFFENASQYARFSGQGISFRFSECG